MLGQGVKGVDTGRGLLLIFDFEEKKDNFQVLQKALSRTFLQKTIQIFL